MAAPSNSNARPGSSRTAGPTLKLHRRVVRLRDRDQTVLTLRPVAQARFSINYFHDTWHVLSDGHGARTHRCLRSRGTPTQGRTRSAQMVKSRGTAAQNHPHTC